MDGEERIVIDEEAEERYRLFWTMIGSSFNLSRSIRATCSLSFTDFKTRIFDLVVILCHSFLVEKQGEDIWYIWGLFRTATVSWRDTRWTVGLQAVNS